MRLPKKIIKKVVRKRLIEFILMILVVSTAIFGVFMMEAKSGTGILYQFDNEWYIDSKYRNNHNYFNEYLGIRNPELFPHVLIPENDGKEVHYRHSTRYPVYATVPIFVTFFTLDLVPIFIIKQFILYFSIVISSFAVFTYLFFNRKRFSITNRLLK